MYLSRSLSQRAQKIQQVLLILYREPPVVVDHSISLGIRIVVIPVARMRMDGLNQICGPAIVQEEDSLAQAPERGGAELVASGSSLADVVRETRPHVVQDQIGKEVCLDIAECCNGGLSSSQRRGVA
jgi:hypothetical protein